MSSSLPDPNNLTPTYDYSRSYEWNFQHGPLFSGEAPRRPSAEFEEFLGLPVRSRVGVAAGPLLHSAWIKLYAALGFDILTYKTVRSQAWPVYAPPNLLVVEVSRRLSQGTLSDTLVGSYERSRPVAETSMANTFGMPSLPPEEWQRDIAIAKGYLQDGQVLVVSVVGTDRGDMTPQELADDFARCAQWAKDAGADIVEINLSCPNVKAQEGQLYRDPAAAELVAATVKPRLGAVPLLAKIGYLEQEDALYELAERLSPAVDGITAINTIPMKIVDGRGQQALPGGAKCGVGGWAVKNAGVQLVDRLHHWRRETSRRVAIVGVGGIMEAHDAEDYFIAGADAVEVATGAILDPYLALRIHAPLQATLSADSTA